MANYTIGDMIYEQRVSKGYSQEALCDGICSVSSLSRIENGSQVPGKKILDALMQRLGVSESVYNVFLSKEEMELYRLTKNLAWCMERFDYKAMEELAKQIQMKLNENDFLEKQYILFVKACILWNRDVPDNDILELLLKAIRITIPDFEPEKGVNSRLLTFDEITIINCLALVKYNSGDEGVGLRLLFELKNYMEEQRIDQEEKAKKYPLIIYNITTRLGKRGRHEEVYELCSKAILFCVEHNKLIILPYLLTNKACAAAELHKTDEAKTLFEQAVMLYTICNKEHHAETIKKQASSQYHIDIS